jgi:riboflavin synthase
MFTGLIEELGTIKQIKIGHKSAVLEISADISKDIKVGESVAINGVCLTAVEINDSYFKAEVMAETLKKTNLNKLKSNSKINIERALKVGDRLDGHIVSGHVDCEGIIISFSNVDIATVIEIKVKDDFIGYLVPKGSIAIDGISLTIVEVKADSFTVSLIPHTKVMTTLGIKKINDTVNLEIDMLARYVEKFIRSAKHDEKKDKISVDFLSQNGFI